MMKFFKSRKGQAANAAASKVPAQVIGNSAKDADTAAPRCTPGHSSSDVAFTVLCPSQGAVLTVDLPPNATVLDLKLLIVQKYQLPLELLDISGEADGEPLPDAIPVQAEEPSLRQPLANGSMYLSLRGVDDEDIQQEWIDDSRPAGMWEAAYDYGDAMVHEFIEALEDDADEAEMLHVLQASLEESTYTLTFVHPSSGRRCQIPVAPTAVVGQVEQVVQVELGVGLSQDFSLMFSGERLAADVNVHDAGLRDGDTVMAVGGIVGSSMSCPSSPPRASHVVMQGCRVDASPDRPSESSGAGVCLHSVI